MKPLSELTLADPEVWLDVPGYEGFYQVSSHHRVQSLTRTVACPTRGGRPGSKTMKGRMTATFICKYTGRRCVNLYRDGRNRKRLISNIVAEAFIGPRPSGREVAHLDGIKVNDWPANLSYKTHAENEADKIEHGTKSFGERNGNAKLTVPDVLAIRSKTPAQAAREHGISINHAMRIIAREVWRHVDA